TDQRTPMAFAGSTVRFYDPVAGRILFDAWHIRWGPRDSVRSRTVLMVRDALMLTGTVAQNIGCGRRDLTMVQIHEAAKKVKAIEFILDLPDGFETQMGEHGVRLKEAQAFRIALARAIIGDPALMIVEEPQLPLSE